MKDVKEANRFSDDHQNENASLLVLAHRLESSLSGVLEPMPAVLFKAPADLPMPMTVPYRRIIE
jgi:hypothetical protein